MSLPGLPISVLPSDIARLLKAHDIQGFHRDCLFVVFGTAGERDKAIKVLQTSQMLGINLKPAEVVEAEESRGSDQPRLRGLGGKNEGLERGVVSGNGPAAGLPNSEIGKSVVLSGLPGKLYGGSLKKELLEEFDLREDVKAVVKIAE
ncbi:hypothetical protein FRC04_011069 [Tulasnella sp. 424]|nr:hypothetical protein FRC04_011069 [Tulasnella sp. 424]